MACTTLARTLCDVVDGRPDAEILGLLDDTVALGARPRWIDHRATELARGRGGVALLARATAPEAHAEFRSWLEREASALFERKGIPAPSWNVPVYDRRGRIGIVDSLWEPWRVVGEYEGLRFHSSPAQRRSDAVRFNRLLEADYEPRRFSWEDVVHRPDAVAESVLRALEGAQRRGGQALTH